MVSSDNAQLPFFKQFFNMDDPTAIDLHTRNLKAHEIELKRKLEVDWDMYKLSMEQKKFKINHLKLNPFGQLIDNAWRSVFVIQRYDSFLKLAKRPHQKAIEDDFDKEGRDYFS